MQAQRIGWAAAAGAVLLTVGAGSARAAKTATFDVTAVHSGAGAQITISSKVWITSTQARADVTYPGGRGQVRYLVTNGSFYELKPDIKKGIKAPLPPEMRKSRDNFNALLGKLAFDASDALKVAQKVRSESMSGYNCDVFVKTMQEGGESRSITVWVPQKMEPRIPVKAIMTDKLQQPGATMEKTVTVTLSNLKVNAPIPASVFAVPTGFQISTPPTKTGAAPKKGAAGSKGGAARKRR